MELSPRDSLRDSLTISKRFVEKCLKEPLRIRTDIPLRDDLRNSHIVSVSNNQGCLKGLDSCII